MIIPRIPLPAFDVGLEVVEVIDRIPFLRVQMIAGFAPVRQGHVIIDADEIDVRIGPKRIKVEQAIPTAVLGLISKILCPICSIADLGVLSQQRTRLTCKVAEPLHSREDASCPPDLGQPAHFGADAKPFDAARRAAKRRIMQDKPRK